MSALREPRVDLALAREHGLTDAEWEQILGILGRAPTFSELGIFSVMWSEHCSYKSSRVHLKTLPTTAEHVLVGPGEGAGAVAIGDGLAVIFKIESHNHPSFIEPTQGAATGVGGILRDVFSMGARPIASMDSLRFGPLEDPKHRMLLRGVVHGIGGYGNSVGVATVGGETTFHECYRGNILVNAFNLGLVEADKIFLGQATGLGNPVIYAGSKTGRDGIHGASLLASAEFDEGSEAKRPTVQVGDPFTEKCLIEACLAAMETGVVVGIQDMGAAGLTCSSFEMASRAGTGIEMDLDRVPQRAANLSPYELLLSESQERMLLVTRAGEEQRVLDIFHDWDLDAVVVGRVTGDGRMRVRWHGETVVDIPVDPVAANAPCYDRPRAVPADLGERQKLDLASLEPESDPAGALVALLDSPNLASKAWIWRQYDSFVQSNTVIGPGGDAALVRVKREDGTPTRKALAMSVDCNPRWCWLDPHAGTVAAVAEAARNVACTGARPLALTNCLNFGNPEKPEIMWEFAESVRGLGDAANALGTPVISGNVSFYNETSGRAIFPTPTVAMVGLLEDFQRHAVSHFPESGLAIVLLGETREELGGSEWLALRRGIEAGLPPAVDLAHEKRLHALLADRPPPDRASGGAIREGADPALDEARALAADGRAAIAALEARLREASGVATLRIRHNGVLGYHVEVASRHGETLLADGGFQHRQTLGQAMRFDTIELRALATRIAAAGAEALAIEARHLDALEAEVAAAADAVAAVAEALARLDRAAALAEVAASQGWVRPQLTGGLDFAIEGGRHPVVEAARRAAGEAFVPNDCRLEDEARVWLLTGPNMGGKSTFLRQNALIAILAQAGSFVPARAARIGLVDRLFSRVGASDNLAQGRSTFMVEMVETAAILREATDRSLLLLDEVGRGTATWDGLALAWAILEALHDRGARTLFATHYHELTALKARLSALALRTLKVKEWNGALVFLHEVVAGAAPGSFGLEVARLAGIPGDVLARARAILAALEAGEAGAATAAALDALPLFAAPVAAAGPPPAEPLRARLAALEPDTLSPRDALDLLYELVREARLTAR